MARYIRDVKLGQPMDVVSMVMDDYMFHEKFQRNDWNGEMVFHKVDQYGADRYFIWSYAGGILHMEAWIKGMAGEEADLDGMYKSSARTNYKASLLKLERDVKNHCQHVDTGLIGQDPLVHDEHHTDANPEDAYKKSEGYNYSYPKQQGNSTDGKVFILAFLALFCVPGVNFIFAIIAFAMSGGMENESLQKIVRVMCIIAILRTFAVVVIFTMRGMDWSFLLPG